MAPVQDAIDLMDAIKDLQRQLHARKETCKLLKTERDRAVAEARNMQKAMAKMEAGMANTAGGSAAVRALKMAVAAQKKEINKSALKERHAQQTADRASAKLLEAEGKLNTLDAAEASARAAQAAAAVSIAEAAEARLSATKAKEDAEKREKAAAEKARAEQARCRQLKQKLKGAKRAMDDTPPGWRVEALLDALAGNDADAADAPLTLEGDRALDETARNAVEVRINAVQKQVGSTLYPVADAMTFAVITRVQAGAPTGTCGLTRLSNDGIFMHRAVAAPEEAAGLFARLHDKSAGEDFRCAIFAVGAANQQPTPGTLPPPLVQTITLRGDVHAGFVGCTHASGAAGVAVFTAPRQSKAGNDGDDDDDESGDDDAPSPTTNSTSAEPVALLSYDPGPAGTARLSELVENGILPPNPFAVFPEAVDSAVLNAARRCGAFEETKHTIPHPDKFAAEEGISLVVWATKAEDLCPRATQLGAVSVPCTDALAPANDALRELETSVRGAHFVAEVTCGLRRPAGALVALAKAERGRSLAATDSLRAELSAMAQARDAANASESELAKHAVQLEMEVEQARAQLEAARQEAAAAAKALEDERTVAADQAAALGDASRLADDMNSVRRELAEAVAGGIVDTLVDTAMRQIDAKANAYGASAPVEPEGTRPAPSTATTPSPPAIPSPSPAVPVEEVGVQTDPLDDAAEALPAPLPREDAAPVASGGVSMTAEELEALKAQVAEEAFARGQEEARNVAPSPPPQQQGGGVSITPEELEALKAQILSPEQIEGLKAQAAQEAFARGEREGRAAAAAAATASRASPQSVPPRQRSPVQPQVPAATWRNFCALLKSTLKHQSARAEAIFSNHAVAGTGGSAPQLRPLVTAANFAAEVLPDLSDAEGALYVALLSLGPKDGMTMSELVHATKESKDALDAAADAATSPAAAAQCRELSALRRALDSPHGRTELGRGAIASADGGSQRVPLLAFAKAMRRLFPSLPTLGCRTQLALAYRAHMRVLGIPHDGALNIDVVAEALAAMSPGADADALAAVPEATPVTESAFVMSSPYDALDEISSVSTDGGGADPVVVGGRHGSARGRAQPGGGREGFLAGRATAAARGGQRRVKKGPAPAPVDAPLDETTSDDSEAPTTRRRRHYA